MKQQFPVGIGGLIFIMLYLASVIFVGWYARRKETRGSLDDYFLGNRAIGAFVLFFTLYATQYSGNTMLGYPGQAYRIGYSWLQSVTFMIGVITGYLLFAPRLHILSKKYRYLTPTDYLYDRTNSRAVAIVAAVLMIWGLGNYLLEQLVAVGHLFEGISGGLVSYTWGIIFFSLVMAILVHEGGFRGVIWGDTIQGITLLLGLFITLGLIMTTFGGLPQAAAKLAAQKPALLGVPKPEANLTWYSTLFLIGIGAAVYPQAIQRIYAAKNENTLKRSFAVMAFMPFVTTFFVFMVGIVAAAAFSHLGTIQADQVFPMLLTPVMQGSTFGYVMGLIVLAAVGAAIMSTADSVLLTMASVVTKDFYSNLNPQAPEERLVYVGRVANWVILIVLALIAWRPLATLWRLTEIKFELMIHVAPAFLLGLYWKRMSTFPTLLGMIAGAVLSSVMSVSGYAKYLGIHSGVWGLALNVLIVVVGSWLIQPSAAEVERVQRRHFDLFEKAGLGVPRVAGVIGAGPREEKGASI